MEVEQFNIPSQIIDNVLYVCTMHYTYVKRNLELPILGEMINAHLIDTVQNTGEIEMGPTFIEVQDRLQKKNMFAAYIRHNEANDKVTLVIKRSTNLYDEIISECDTEIQAWDKLEEYTALIVNDFRRDYLREKYNEGFDIYGMRANVYVPKKKQDW